MIEKIHYQRNRVTIEQKIIIKITKKYEGKKQKINTESYMKTKKILTENMEEIDIKICLKKTKKD